MQTERPRPQRPFPRLLGAAAGIALGARLLGPSVQDRMEWVPVAQAASQAQLRGRPMFYNFTAEWCAPCKRLERDVFADPYLATRLSRDYVAVRVTDREREEGRNSQEVEELQGRFGVEAFPTLVLARTDGTVIARLEGCPDRRTLWRFINQGKAALQK